MVTPARLTGPSVKSPKAKYEGAPGNQPMQLYGFRMKPRNDRFSARRWQTSARSQNFTVLKSDPCRPSLNFKQIGELWSGDEKERCIGTVPLETSSKSYFGQQT